VLAIAYDAKSQRLAIGDTTGVSVLTVAAGKTQDGSLGVEGRHWRRYRTSGPVNDVYFDAAGTLWVGAWRGLWRLTADGRLEDRTPGTGEAARFVHRVHGAGGLLVAATEGGAWLSQDGTAWQRISDGLGQVPTRAVALRVLPMLAADGGPQSGGGSEGAAAMRQIEIWLLGRENVWRATAQRTGDPGKPVAVSRAEREVIPGSPHATAPVDLLLDVPGAGLAVVFPRAIARVLPASTVKRRWEVIHPVLPPGAVVRRISRTPDALWLGTDQGLLSAAALPGPWRRTASPARTAPTRAVVADRDRVIAASSLGLMIGLPDDGPGLLGSAAITMRLRHRSPFDGLPVDPDLALVHRRALAYAGLEPDYFRGLRKGVGRRGWLPTVSLRAGAGYDRDTTDDLDQSFTYGELHNLRDYKTLRSRDVEGSLTLTWDLGDVAYAPEADDLSREERQVISLRDNVLDEINQLYFDRRRALVSLAAYADRDDPEAVALEIRCRELAAGLDAWTGGWFSSKVQPPGAAPHDLTP
jgi:hypothetical protein